MNFLQKLFTKEVVIEHGKPIRTNDEVRMCANGICITYNVFSDEVAIMHTYVSLFQFTKRINKGETLTTLYGNIFRWTEDIGAVFYSDDLMAFVAECLLLRSSIYKTFKYDDVTFYIYFDPKRYDKDKVIVEGDGFSIHITCNVLLLFDQFTIFNVKHYKYSDAVYFKLSLADKTDLFQKIKDHKWSIYE